MANISSYPPDADESIQLLMLSIARSLVNNIEAVHVSCLEENGAVTLNLRVDSSDAGRIIGAQGRTARSIRTVLSAAGMKLHRRYSLNIEEYPTRLIAVGQFKPAANQQRSRE
jgi:uncharacterized protein